MFGIRNRGSIKEGTSVYPIKTSATGARNCIFMSLGGNPTKQAAKRTTPFQVASCTSKPERLLRSTSSCTSPAFGCNHSSTIQPALLRVELNEYEELLRRFAPTADKYRQSKKAVAFGPGAEAARLLSRPARSGGASDRTSFRNPDTGTRRQWYSCVRAKLRPNTARHLLSTNCPQLSANSDKQIP